MIIYNDKGKKLLEIEVDDNSYRHRVIMGDYNLTLYYSLAEHVELPVGCYCDYQGERFTLERPEAFKMKHSFSARSMQLVNDRSHIRFINNGNIRFNN